MPNGKICEFSNNLYYGDTQSTVVSIGKGVEYITWNVTGRNDTLASVINYNPKALFITPSIDTEDAWKFIWQYRSQHYAFICALDGKFSRATQNYTDLLNSRFRYIILSLPSDIVYPININMLIFK